MNKIISTSPKKIRITVKNRTMNTPDGEITVPSHILKQLAKKYGLTSIDKVSMDFQYNPPDPLIYILSNRINIVSNQIAVDVSILVNGLRFSETLDIEFDEDRYLTYRSTWDRLNNPNVQKPYIQDYMHWKIR